MMSAGPCQGTVCPGIRIPAWSLLLAIFIVGESLAAEIKPSRTIMPNGLTVVTLDQPSLPIITVNVMVKAGAVHDPDALAGLSSMVAQMLDEIATVSGVRGVMLTFDDFIIGMEQFGTRILPLMRSRGGIRQAA